MSDDYRMKAVPPERGCLAGKSCTCMLFERRPRENELALDEGWSGRHEKDLGVPRIMTTEYIGHWAAKCGLAVPLFGFFAQCYRYLPSA